PVGGPAGVADAHGVVGGGGRHAPLELGDLADGARERDVRARIDRGDPGAVVAAVLEPLEAADEDRLGGPMADVSDDSAHSGVFLVGAGSRPGAEESYGRWGFDEN